MKMYNQNSDKIEVVPKTLTFNNVNRLTTKMNIDDLNTLGYYKIDYSVTPNRRYFTQIEDKVLVNNIYEITIIPVDRPLQDVQNALLKTISDTFKTKMERPVVDTGLGYSVDGSRVDIQNFQMGKKYALPQVKDVDGVFHNVTDADYDTIITAIETSGIGLYNIKWTKEAIILGLTNVSDCMLYEKTPYDVLELQWDDLEQTIATLDPDTGLQVELRVTKYKNKSTDWS